MNSPICAVCQTPVGPQDSAAYCTATRTIFHLRCYLVARPATQPASAGGTARRDRVVAA
jgi:hypothetical protein